MSRFLSALPPASSARALIQNFTSLDGCGLRGVLPSLRFARGVAHAASALSAGSSVAAGLPGMRMSRRTGVARRAAAAAAARFSTSSPRGNETSAEDGAAERAAMFDSGRPLRNVAVIAHVDHGKTSLVDRLLRHCEPTYNTSMDSNPLERERGITILAKCTSMPYKNVLINIVDTPGHADFGGEVERVLNMVDGVLLVVDAAEGPMPQTRYVLAKALAQGLRPVVVLNKCDREGARIGAVENEILDLFVALDANDEQLDFPIVYASAREGWTGPSEKPETRQDMSYLLDVLVQHVPAPRVMGGPEQPFRMLVSQMDFEQFTGKLLIGRVLAGTVKPGDAVVAMSRVGDKIEEAKVTKLLARRAGRDVPLSEAVAGDIIQLAGLAKPRPTATVAHPSVTRPLFADPIDPPTISMGFGVNDSPLGGREGTKLTSSLISDRLNREAATNVSLQVLPAVPVEGMPDATEVRARGELQLAILIENMRREGFELSVSPPVVLFKRVVDAYGAGGSTDDTILARDAPGATVGELLEPYEVVVIDLDDTFSGMAIERMAQRKGNLLEFAAHTAKGAGKTRLTFSAPSRGLLGFQSELQTESRGTATLHRVFDKYGAYVRDLDRKPRAVMVSNCAGVITAYALESLQARGSLLVSPGDPTYTGHVIGECSRDSAFDMDVNPVKAKKLTNIRAAGADDAIRVTPPRILPLEEALVYIAPDELVEVTPSVLRIRKRVLDPGMRLRTSRAHAKATKD